VAAAAGIGVVCVVIVVIVALLVKRQVDQTSRAVGQILEGPQSAPIIVEERTGRPTIVLPLCSGERVDRATVSVGTSTLHYVRTGASPSTSGSIHIGKAAPDGIEVAAFTIAPPDPVVGFSLEPADLNPSEIDLRSRLVVTITTSLHRYRSIIDARDVSPSVAASSTGTMSIGDELSFHEVLSVGAERCGDS
jgi:hypothetical protein